MRSSHRTRWNYLFLILAPFVCIFLTRCNENNVDPACDKTGQACDDGNPETHNDVYDAACLCAGVLHLFTDPRDGQTYKTVKIGDQIWLAENLNYDPAAGNSWCYEDDTANCAVYGRLYDWETAKTACPAGWHLPSEDEWDQLIAFLGGEAAAGGKIRWRCR